MQPANGSREIISFATWHRRRKHMRQVNSYQIQIKIIGLECFQCSIEGAFDVFGFVVRVPEFARELQYCTASYLTYLSYTLALVFLQKYPSGLSLKL